MVLFFDVTTDFIVLPPIEAVYNHAIKAQLDKTLGSAPKVADNATQIYATPRATRLLEDAKTEADRLKDDFIGAEHLFIAAVMESQGDAAQILKEHGIDQ